MSQVSIKPLFFVALLSFGVAQARPVVIENQATFGTPDSTYTTFGQSVAIDGDYALVTASRTQPDPNDPGTSFQPVYHTAFLFLRDGTRWTLVRRLDEYLEDPDFRIPAAVAMRGGVAAVQTVSTDFYELIGGVWTRTGTRDGGDGPGRHLVVDNGRVLSGEGTCDKHARVFEKDSAGVWHTSALLRGDVSRAGCDDEFRGGSADLSGPWAVVWQPDPEGRSAHALIFRDYGGTQGWYTLAYGAAEPPPGATGFGPEVAMLGTDVFVSGGNENGTYVFRETPAYGFNLAGTLQPVDGFMGAGHATALRGGNGLLFARARSYDGDAEVIHVFRPRADLTYEHVATLVGKNGESLGTSIAISGRRVLVGANGNGLVHTFELPVTFAAPTPLRDNFASGNGTGWTVSAGSDYLTVPSGATRVFRQRATAIDTRAVLVAADWTNQAIEVDVKATASGGTGAGFGLATRYQGPQNYYDAVLRPPNRVEFRRMASGTLRTIASATVPIPMNRNFRLRLESIGTRHCVYVDRASVIDVDVAGPTHGRATLLTERMAADFDNVVVTPSPLTTIYRTDFENGAPGPWTQSGFGYWNLWTGASTLWNQSSIAGDARASIGAPTDDQVVRVRARLDTFAAPSGNQERWFGVMARQADERNYYYLTLRSSNTLSLRKLVNGIGTTLATTTLQVNPATWYDLRLEAVGDQIRAYVNGTLRLEVSDTTHSRGTSGPVMFKAAADYDDFVAYQP